MMLWTAVKRYHLQDDMINSINSQIQQVIQTQKSTTNGRGALLTPFSDDLGNAPATNLYSLGSLYNHIDISIIVIREVIVIGGGVANGLDLFEGPMRAEIAQRTFPSLSRHVKIRPAECGDNAGLLGAAWLAFEATRGI